MHVTLERWEVREDIAIFWIINDPPRLNYWKIYITIMLPNNCGELPYQ